MPLPDLIRHCILCTHGKKKANHVLHAAELEEIESCTDQESKRKRSEVEKGHALASAAADELHVTKLNSKSVSCDIVDGPVVARRKDNSACRYHL